ncbi:MAG: prolipoprotein diacylglyceryl transferase [Bacillota bacterium]|nr:prolipoprotein diacylglyceryl transferase [Bacillota bacterium]
MHPVLFTIDLSGGSVISITAYRFFGMVALLYLAVAAVYHFRRSRLGFFKTTAVLLVVIISFFIGARLLYGLLYFEEMIANPDLLGEISFRNFTLFGGLAAALLAWWLLAKILGLPFLKLTDTLAPHVGVGTAIARIGCFLNGCCYGKVTDLPWAVVFPIGSPVHINQVYFTESPFLLVPQPVHPTQLYEMAAGLLAALVSWLVYRRRTGDGAAAAVFGLVFTAGRFVTYFFRDFSQASPLSNLIRGPLVYGLAFLIFACWLYKIIGSTKNREAV